MKLAGYLEQSSFAFFLFRSHFKTHRLLTSKRLLIVWSIKWVITVRPVSKQLCILRPANQHSYISASLVWPIIIVIIMIATLTPAQKSLKFGVRDLQSWPRFFFFFFFFFFLTVDCFCAYSYYSRKAGGFNPFIVCLPQRHSKNDQQTCQIWNH